MQCLKIEELLSPYLDEVLSPPVREDVASHLAVCTNCREKFEALSEVVNCLKDLPEIAPPPEFSALVIAKVAADKNTGKAAIFKNFNRSNWARAFSLAAAFVLTLGVTALMYGMPGQWKSTPPVIVHREGTITDVQNDNDEHADTSVLEYIPLEELKLPGDGSSQGSSYSGTGVTVGNPEPASSIPGNGIPAPAGVPIASQKMAQKEGTIFQQVAYGQVPAASKESRNVVRSATLALSTEDPSVVPEKIADLADDNGGYLVPVDPENGTLAVKVPADRFKNVLSGIREIGDADTRRIEGKDVSEELYCYEDTLRELANEEQKLLIAMNSAKSPVESQAAQERLAKVQKDMERQKKLHSKLLNDTQLATIKINLR